MIFHASPLGIESLLVFKNCDTAIMMLSDMAVATGGLSFKKSSNVAKICDEISFFGASDTHNSNKQIIAFSTYSEGVLAICTMLAK